MSRNHLETYFHPVTSNPSLPAAMPRIAFAFGKVLSSVRGCLGKFSSSKPPEPAAEVVELLQDMKITPRLVMLGANLRNLWIVW